MLYQQYVGLALETIAQELLYQVEDPWKLYVSTSEQAEAAFLQYVSVYTGSELTLFQAQHGARLQRDLSLVWPLFLHELS